MTKLSMLLWWLPATLACGHVMEQPDAATDLPDAGAPDSAPVSRTVRLTMTNEPTTSLYFVAARDGDGPWAAAARVSPGHYQLEVRTGRYQIAIGCGVPDGGAVTVYGLTPQDTTDLTLPAMCRTAADTVRLSGVVSSPLRVSVSAGFFITNASPTYALDVPPGTHDVLAATYTGTGSTLHASKVLMIKNLVVTQPRQYDIAFDALAVSPTTHAVTVPVGPGETAQVNSLLMTPTTGITLSRSTTPPFTYESFPAAQLVDALHIVSARVSTPDHTTSLMRWGKGDADVMFTAPDPIEVPQPTLLTRAPYPRFGVTWPAAPAADVVELSAGQPACGGICYVGWDVIDSTAFLRAGGQLEFPDLSLVPGWEARYQLELGSPATIATSAMRLTGGAPALFTAPAEGREQTTFARSLTITP